MIFFSGHGVTDNKNGYFLPKDADPNRLFNSGFAYSIWRPFIDNINCKHILVAIDACFSGTFDPSWWEGRRDPFKRPGELEEGALLIANHENHVTRYFFTSATEKETPDKSKFAKKFKEALTSKGGKDGILTSTELFTYLEVANPTPHRGEFGKDEPESSYLFISTNRNENLEVNSTVSRAEQKVWDKALEDNTIQAYEAYVKAYPEGSYVTVAENIISRIEDWTAPTRRYTYVVDKDRNAYTVLKMKDGKQWMTQNLNVKVTKSYCYDDKPENCQKYGRLYKWKAAQKACESLGDGWRLPTDDEWREMAKKYGGSDDDASDDGKAAYKALIENGSSGFDARLGGYRYTGGEYHLEGTYGFYWSSTQFSSDGAWLYYFDSGFGELDRIFNLKGFARSVRCLQD